MKWKLLVISSPKAAERHQMIKSMLAGANYDWDFIYADSQEVQSLNYDPKKSIRSCGRELQLGELGCYASHFKCWQYLLDHSSYEYLMVLEDDVFLDTKFNFDQLIQQINNCQIDYIRLYSRAFPANKLVGKLSLHRKIYRFKEIAYGTQCYILSKLGAEKLTTVAKEGVTRPVDDEIDRFWHNKLPSYAYYPYPALEQEFKSTIINELPPTSATGYDNFVFKLNQKRDHFFRWLFNIRHIFDDKKLSTKLFALKK